MPDAIGPSARLPNVRRNRRPELVGLAVNGFVGDIDAALGQQNLDIAQPHGIPEIVPGRLADDVWREAVALERNGTHVGLHRPKIVKRSQVSVSLTTPAPRPFLQSRNRQLSRI